MSLTSAIYINPPSETQGADSVRDALTHLGTPQQIFISTHRDLTELHQAIVIETGRLSLRSHAALSSTLLAAGDQEYLRLESGGLLAVPLLASIIEDNQSDAPQEDFLAAEEELVHLSDPCTQDALSFHQQEEDLEEAEYSNKPTLVADLLQKTPGFHSNHESTTTVH